MWGLYGKTIYVTKAEEYRLYAKFGWVVGAVGAAVTMELLRRRAARRLNERPSVDDGEVPDA
jgi:hypothetical protein